MAQEKELTKCIPAIYKKSYENLGLFFYVSALKEKIPAITIDQAIYSYFHFIGEDWDIETARVNYQRLLKDYKNCDCEVT